MKQGVDFKFSIRLKKVDPANVESVDLIFKSDSPEGNTLEFHAPSDNATITDGVVTTYWNESQTWLFPPEYPVVMDSRVHMVGTPYVPYTPKLRLRMDDTVWKRVENHD